jgi:hypothetical protein
MLELQLLPAKQGDAIWVRWQDGARTRQLFIDMGTEAIGKDVRTRLTALPEDQRALELLVVTHIDSDHIGGVLSCLVKEPPLPGLSIADVWFNGLDHLKPPKPRTLEDQGGVQGKQLMDWLAGQRWNAAFGGGRVCRDGKPTAITLPGGLKVTVLGPGPQRLEQLAPVWTKELVEALRKQQLASTGKLEAFGGRKSKPRLPSRVELTALAAKVSGRDDSKANGSSIVLLVEHDGHRILLTGDAYAGDLVEHLATLGEFPIALDAFKLPHHGSLENTTRAMIEAVDCPLFLFSTDGTRFEHPHAEAVACVIEHGRGARKRVELGFNARSKFTGWWDDPAWAARFKYRARYGDADGLTLRFD